MVSAAESADRLDQHRTFIDAAAEAGVRHIVYTSFLGAAPDATFTLARDHWVTEEHIRASGLAFTFLRDSFYLDFLPALAGEDGVIRGPAGDGLVRRGSALRHCCRRCVGSAGSGFSCRTDVQPDRTGGTDALRGREHHHRSHRQADHVRRGKRSRKLTNRGRRTTHPLGNSTRGCRRTPQSRRVNWR